MIEKFDHKGMNSARNPLVKGFLSELETVTMKAPDIHAIAEQLNSRARQHPIGDLQKLRSTLKRLSRRPGQDIFSFQTTFDHGAFHHGGARELQFNIWTEDGRFRHGLAFCFSRTQTLQDPVGVLGPKARLFNRFLRLHPKLYADLDMWHYDEDGSRSTDYTPQPIPEKLMTEDAFIFLGRRQRLDRIDYEGILDDFDRLLPLYTFVEGGGRSRGVSISPDTQFVFCAGCPQKKASAIASQAKEQHDVILRHNELQVALYRKLRRTHGAHLVGTECRCCGGTKVDVVVRRGGGYWFYEIKVADSARACIRQAVGQLLEYAYWPGGPSVSRLMVVGEPDLDAAGNEYLRRLRKQFSLPIEYERFSLPPD